MMKFRKGFTMIELILAMGFLSTLLVTIAILVNMITGIYQKGLSLRAVNAVGKQIVDELSRAVGGSPIMPDINPVDSNFSYQIDSTEIATALHKYFYSNPIDQPEQDNGVFCTGAFSYIWNTQRSYSVWANDHNNLEARVLKLRYNGGDPWTYKLARVVDPERSVCSAVVEDDLKIIDVTTEPIEMINSDESDLILYDFSVFPATQNSITGQTFYSATFILATMKGGVNIMTNAEFCDSTAGQVMGLVTDFNYCAVNKFNFAMRATGFTDLEDQYGERGTEEDE